MDMEQYIKKAQKGLMIGGVEVKFPFKPYPSQLSMMSMIIRGIQNQKHCLLESPTGSGKSLALLCSALAWQDAAKCALNALSADSNVSCTNDSDAEERMPKIPQIWFGTRTHKQIAQITHELGQTAYKSVKMTILSSRDYSCINSANNSGNKNEGCKDLVKGKHPDMPDVKCHYFSNRNRMSTFSNLESMGFSSAWDLEDFKALGDKQHACPFYASRALKGYADIIFCPYNYLIDANIRQSMEINLENQIVILDEAHNIEDCARDAASHDLNETDLASTVADLDYLIQSETRVDNHVPLHLVCVKIGQWIQRIEGDLDEVGFELYNKIWTGPDFIKIIEETWGVTLQTVQLLKNSLTEATKDDEPEDESEAEEGKKKQQKIMHSASKTFLSSLCNVLEYMLTTTFTQDYKICLMKTMKYGYPRPKRTREGWVSFTKKPVRHAEINLHFWCLNSAVAFNEMHKTRCVILTSGTLSPMASFSSELGMNFSIQLEASHVIPNSQVWVGSVGTGPNGTSLKATYHNVNSFEFQDDLGHLVSTVCSVTPQGVLCFFSSYKLLEKLCERWKNTNLWQLLLAKKRVYCEASSKNKDEFDNLLKEFYRTISTTTHGALLFAVCRGKVSEGMDFSDDNARAVITVGIPYPAFKDKQVELKRQYNDENKSRGLLSGHDWYEIQAFRALNQALGRCIRHRNDWGALIIVDERFCQAPRRYCQGLSKWIREKVRSYSVFDDVVKSLSSFCSNQTKRVNELASAPPSKSAQSDQGLAPSKSAQSDQGLAPSKSAQSDQGLATMINASPPTFSLPSLKVDGDSNVKNAAEFTSFVRKDVKTSKLANNIEPAATHVTSNGGADSRARSKHLEVKIDFSAVPLAEKNKPESKRSRCARKKPQFKTVAAASPDAPQHRNFFSKTKECENKNPATLNCAVVTPESSRRCHTTDEHCSTPKTAEVVRVVPESPDCVIVDDDDDDDFVPSTRVKARRRKSQGRPSKKCKMSIAFDDDDEPDESTDSLDRGNKSTDLLDRGNKSTDSFEVNNETRELSQEYMPRTRKKRTRSLSKEARVICHQRVDAHLLDPVSFAPGCWLLIRERFPHVTKLHVWKNFFRKSLECADKFDIVRRKVDDRLSLDSVWCEQENLVYQFFSCKTDACPKTVGFRVRNAPDAATSNSLFLFGFSVEKVSPKRKGNGKSLEKTISYFD